MGKLSKHAADELAAQVAAELADGRQIVLNSDHSETIEYVSVWSATPSKPKSRAPEDIEEWLAADDGPHMIPLTADGPAQNGTITFNVGALSVD
jgi:hypothetical protein